MSFSMAFFTAWTCAESSRLSLVKTLAAMTEETSKCHANETVRQ
jgi:hypothetical protein